MPTTKPARLLTEDMRSVLTEQRLGFVATICPNGTANLSPKGTVAVWDDQHLVFAERSPRTIHNLRHNPAVEIYVVDPIARAGYRFNGEESILTGGPVFDWAIQFFGQDDLTDAGRRIQAIALILVSHAVPLVSPAYDLGLSEQEIQARWQCHHQGLWEAWEATRAAELGAGA